MEKRSKIKTLAVVLFTIGIIFSTMMIFPGDQRKWTVLGAQVVDNPAEGDNSGICGFFIFVADSDYAANLTDGSPGYVSGGAAINATEIDMQHTVMQDLIVWARFNNTDSGLDVQFTRCNLTWTGNISSLDAPDQTNVIVTTAKFIFINFVWEDYTCLRNQKNIAIDDIIIQGFK